MADVFVSYSRRNADFVRRLHAFLTEKGKDVWVDWEDIPPASEWREDIAQNIDGTAGFVFVVSPDSLGSEECAKELDHALGRGKRIVPIACEQADPAGARDELRRLNWIWCRENDDRDAALESVLRALDTDLEWTREHTRLLVRAVEWDANGRNSSFLLRGSDLRDAEQQLAAGAAKDPPPTELQSSFILASRHAATRRQRLLLAGVSVALAVAAVLGVLALLQRNDARRATRSAVSVALASAANEQLAPHPDEALLLALAAYESSPSAEARGAALGALEEARKLGVSEFLYGDSTVDSLAFSPDGRTVAVGSDGGAVHLWDVHDRAELATLTAPGAGPVVSIGFGPGGVVMAASSNGVVRLWNASSGRVTEQLEVQGGLAAAAISPDGSLVAAADGRAHLWLWNLRTGSRRRLSAPRGDEVALAFSHDGRTLAAGVTDESFSPKMPNAPPETPGAVAVYDARRPSLLGMLPNHEKPVSDLAFSPHGDTLATAGSNTKFIFTGAPGTRVSGELRLWNARRLKATGQVVRSMVPITSVAFLPDGRTVFAGREDGSVQLASPSTGKWIGRRREPLGGSSFTEGATIPLALSRDGSTFAVAAPDSTSVRFGPVRHGLELGRTIVDRREHFQQAAFLAGGRTLALLGQSTTGRLGITLVGVRTGAMRTPGWLRALRYPDQFAFSADGRTLAVSNLFSGVVGVWNLHTHEETGRVPRPSGQLPIALAFSPSGSELAIEYADSNGVLLWNVQGHRLIGRTADPAGVAGLAFSGSDVLIVGSDWSVDRWDGRSAPRRVLTPPAGAAASGVTGSNAWLWKLVAALAGSEGGKVVDGATSSPDGKTLALVQNLTDARIELWDVGTRTQLGTPLEGPENPGSVAFSPDGTTLAAVNGDAVRIWRGLLWRNVAQLRTRICNVVLGSFTPSEWSAIAPGIALPHPCGS